MKKHGAIFVLSILAVISFTTSMAIAECGDICVSETGWWCDGGEFNPSGTPIQDAIDNAATCCGDFTCVDPCIICVTDGSYTENVDVTTANLVITSENGADSTTVTAANANDHVFYLQADCITIDGFEIIGATIDAYGVNLSYGDSCTIKNNHIRSNEDGIYAEYSDSLIIENNLIYDNDDDGIHGIYEVGGETTISRNIIYDNGVDGIGSIEYIHGDLNICDNEIYGNGWDGIYYIHEVSGETTISRNIIYDNDREGIDYIWYIHGDLNICDNEIYGNGRDGIYEIYDVDGETTITDNEIYSNGEGGIYLVYDVDGETTISSNKIYDNGDSGIEDISELYNDLNICDNEIYGNGYVGLYGDDGICDIYKVDGVTTISGNSIHENSDSGIEDIYDLYDTLLISDNAIYNNGEEGIGLIYGLNGAVTITGNTITNNVLYGISLSASSNNLIYNNYFDNMDNAYDDGTNIWNTTPTLGENIIGGSWLGGNYWGDYAGKDETGDGLGDTMLPYNSSGDIVTGGDYLPLVPVSTVQFNTELESGWNLVSVPLNLTSWQLGAESVVGDPLNVTPKNSLTSIYRYNTTTGIFDKCDHFDDLGWWPATGSESFTELEPGRGYWVMAKNDCTLILTGTAPSDLDITLNADWNLIGWYSMEEALLGDESVVGDPLNVTPKNSLSSIYRYNTTEAEFEKCDHFDNLGWWPATGSESFTELEPGSGYWIMAKNDCVWKHEA